MIVRLLGKMYRSLFIVPVSITMHRLQNRLFGRRTDDEPAPLRHPIDSQYGIDTSGVISYTQLSSGKAADKYNICYGGSQPSIIRKTLAGLANHHALTFLDLGCGKGRALAVASEFPFRRIVGVELAPSLVSIAKANAEVLRSKFPDRTPIEVVEGDVLAVPIPTGSVVVYFYHPFYRGMMKKVARKIEKFVKSNSGIDVFVIYYNPVYFDIFDRSKKFRRIFAKTIEFEPGEKGTGPSYHDESDAIAVWRSADGATADLSPRSYAEIKVVPPGWRAFVVK